MNGLSGFFASLCSAQNDRCVSPVKNMKITIPKKPRYIKFAEDADFFELFRKIDSVVETCFFLESLGSDGDKSRYSVIGFKPEKVLKSNPKFKYSDLHKIMPKGVISEDYTGGLVGYLGFDVFEDFEPKVKIKRHPLFDEFMKRAISRKT